MKNIVSLEHDDTAPELIDGQDNPDIQGLRFAHTLILSPDLLAITAAMKDRCEYSHQTRPLLINTLVHFACVEDIRLHCPGEVPNQGRCPVESCGLQLSKWVLVVPEVLESTDCSTVTCTDKTTTCIIVDRKKPHETPCSLNIVCRTAFARSVPVATAMPASQRYRVFVRQDGLRRHGHGHLQLQNPTACPTSSMH